VEKNGYIDPYTTVMNYLSITPGKWEIKYNENIRGISGKEHRFDAVYRSQEGEIVTVMVVLRTEDLEKRLDDFKNGSKDVRAKRKFLIVCGEINSDMVSELKSENISILMLPGMFCSQVSSYNADAGSNDAPRSLPDGGIEESQRKRSRANIIMDLIRAINENSNQIPVTRLFYACNINHRMGRSIIEDLEHAGIVILRKTGPNRNVVELTRKGISLINDYEFIREILEK